MDLRQLRYFLVLADELHFRRAAERLNVTQAPLSLAIQALERELGALLFNRTRRRVELTESGHALRAEASAILERVQRSRETIRDLADGITGSLRIGVTPACCLMPFFGNLIGAFRSARPKVRVTLHEMSSMDQLIALQAREVDAAIIRNPPKRFAADISVTRLTADPLVVAMSSNHRLRDRPTPAIADSRDESFVNYPRHSGVGIYEQVIALCALRGFTPRAVQEAEETLTLLGLASTRGNEKFSASYGGARYLFATAAHREAFLKNPRAYLPEFGGFCVVGAAYGEKVDTDPETGKVVNGHLYLNNNARALGIFDKDHTGTITKAETHWPTIKDKAL